MATINDLFNQYLAEGGNGDATTFGVWLIRNGSDFSIDIQPVKIEASPIPLDSLTAILVGRLERFVHMETKQALKKVGISNPDEFALMSTLFYMGRTTKTLLLKQCLFELTTGSQMLKRLNEDGYLIERQHPEDRRSSIIELSSKGRERLLEAYEQLNAIKGMTEGLATDQQQLLVSLLQKLDHTHSKRHQLDTIQDVLRKRSPGL
jgi:DNA-binding MarR family transcriptional regulator